MNIPPVAPIPNFRAGERHEDGQRPRREPHKKAEAVSVVGRALTESLPSGDYDMPGGDDEPDRGHFTDQTV